MALVYLSSILLVFAPAVLFAADPLVIPITAPSSPSSSHVVKQNFLGISFELSFLDDYFGTGASSIPKPILNYLGALRSRTGSNPVRIRVGGNSLDTSTYVPTQGSPMIQRQVALNSDNQPARYGPVVWDVLSKVALSIEGAAYIIGLSLINATNPLVAIAASDAYTRLGSDLDAFLLGNVVDDLPRLSHLSPLIRVTQEPDVYASHGFRSATNWTEATYIKDYRTSSNQLANTTGSILTKHILAGPAACCNWSLNTLINDGYISDFGDYLKYIALQHYASSNCKDKPFSSNASYFSQHANVVQLATWQKAGIDVAISKNEKVIMSEFNSISCGGVPGISNTFLVGSLWTVDYALQLASVGFSAAHIHTREPGISYNLFTSSDQPTTSSSTWTTNPSFYGVLITAEALRSNNGAIVVDLNLGGNSKTAAYAGYAVYDAGNKTLQQLVLFNYANVSVSDKQKLTFSIPQSTFSASTGNTLVVKYLGGQSMSEKTNVAWGGATYANVRDGNMVKGTATWAPASVHVDCSKGCNIDVPGPGLAVAFAGGQPNAVMSSSNSSAIADGNTSSASLRLYTRRTANSFVLAVFAIYLLW